jgi:ribosomal protein L32
MAYHIGRSKWRAMYIRRPRKERSRWRAVWDKGVPHEVQICVYCGGNGDIDHAVCPKCLEKRKEARKRFYNLFKKRHYAS